MTLSPRIPAKPATVLATALAAACTATATAQPADPGGAGYPTTPAGQVGGPALHAPSTVMLGRWVRFSAAEARGRGDGFSPSTLGFPGPLLKLFFRAHRLLALPGARDCVRRLYRRTMRGTCTIAWLQGPFGEPHEWLDSGRLLQRLWLTLTMHGVQLHPFGSIVTNRETNERAHDLLKMTSEAGTFWLAARLGHSAEPPRSHRLETEQLLVA